MQNRQILFLFLPALAALCGCATYHAVPLDSAAVDAALAAPDLVTVRKQASGFKHPSMQPLVFDDRDGLSPEELAVLAVLANPQLKAERDRCGVADAQVLQAGLLPNPQLSTGLDIPTVNGSMPDLYTGGIVDLSWDVKSLITHSAKRRAAQAAYASVRLDVAWQEWQVAEAARLHAYRLLNLREQLAIAREVEADGQQRLALDKRAASERRITASDEVIATEAARRNKTNRLAIQQALGTEEADLKLAVGVPPDTRLPLQPVSIDLSNAPSGIELATKWSGGIEQRLDLLALKQGYASQEENVRAAIRSQFPAINIGANAARDTSNVKTIGLGVSVNLPLFDRGQGRIAQERATRKQLFDDYTARVSKARASLKQMGMQMDFVLKQWGATHEGAADLAQQVTLAKMAYDEGRLDAASYYDFRDQWLGLRLEELAKQNEWIDLRLALALAAGHPIAPHLEM